MENVVVVVTEENQDLIKSLQQNLHSPCYMFSVDEVKNPRLVHLPSRGNSDRYLIPRGIKNSDLRLLCTESGGEKVDTFHGVAYIGEAEVICGLQGQALVPCYVPTGKDLEANGNQAYFLTSAALVRIYCEHSGSSYLRVKIHRLTLKVQKDTAIIKEEKLLQFGQETETVPKGFRHFLDAINAAIVKANCGDHTGCRHVHYAKGSIINTKALLEELERKEGHRV